MKTTCPAKINSFLSVGPPDGSGLHPLRTVFHAVSLTDLLEAELAASDEFEVCGAELPEVNTVTRAWRLAKEYVETPALRVKLTKRVPMESGLGGGSSDAAGMLRLLGLATRGRLEPKDQHEIASAVGADVPFFLVGGSAIGEGYGGDLTPLPDTPSRPLVIIRPDVGVSTAVAYRRLDEANRPWLEISEDLWSGHNDFAPVAPTESIAAINWLVSQGASKAGLSGSGSAVWGAFDSEAEATRAASLAGHRGAAWACRTLSREESLWTS